MPQWISRKEQEIPKDVDVLVVFRGRIGVLNWPSEGEISLAFGPQIFASIWKMCEEDMKKIYCWMPIQELIENEHNCREEGKCAKEKKTQDFMS